MMNTQKLKSLIEQIINSSHLSEDELNPYIDELLKLSPDPNILDYIFWEEMTIDEIMLKVENYTPIIL